MLVVALARAVIAGESFSAPREESSRAAVTIKELPSQTVVYLESQGAYWRVGPVLAQVFEYQKSAHLQGSVFVRYLQDPARTAPAALRVWVGIALDGFHEPVPPFQMGQRSPEKVASFAVESGSLEPARAAAMLAAWADEHGYTSAGTLTEVYGSVEGRSPSCKELQWTLREIEPVREVSPNSESTPIVMKVLPRQPVEEFPPADTSLAQDQGDPGEPARPTEPVITRTIELAARTSDPIIEAKVEFIPPPKSDPVAAAGPTIEEQLRRGDFDVLAERLIQSGRRFDHAQRIWMVQWISRIGAAGRGVEKPTDVLQAPITGLHSALIARYDAAIGSYKADMRDGLAATLNSNEPLAAPRRALLRDLDVLLAKIGMHSIPSDAVLGELAAILAQVVPLNSK